MIKKSIAIALLCSSISLADNWCWDNQLTPSSQGASFAGIPNNFRASGESYQPISGKWAPWPNGTVAFRINEREFILPLDYKWSDQAASVIADAIKTNKRVWVNACAVTFNDLAGGNMSKTWFVVTAIHVE